jgi:signal transduction histidine kinase
VVDAYGHPIYLRGTTQDITDRKLSEQALLAVSGRLITAQEEERARIARELHDDLSQRMALLHVSLEEFKRSIPGSASQVEQQLDNIVKMRVCRERNQRGADSLRCRASCTGS